MKKAIVLLAAMMAFVSGYGVPLTPTRALQRISGSSKIAPALGKKIQSPQLVLTGKTEAGQPAYYVFTNSSGTLFVSADDIATPLLGYTESDIFDPNEMPPQLKWWLEQYARQIDYASHRVIDGDITNSRKSNADAHLTASMAAISPLLKTTWDQGNPYNKYCPTVSGVRVVTGCVATSMAQVMNYHQWPQAQVPAISYVYSGVTLTSPATIIDWNNMLDSYSRSYTTDQANAVARLMQMAGYSVEMEYNTASNGGSGAHSEDIRGALVNTFGYDVAIDYAIRDYYETAEWEQMIYNNLLTCGPVIYDGTGSEGGHSFVCDGYDGKGAFHINWGWSGLSDGYFVLSALDPDALGAGGGDGGFNYYQGAVLGIQRPQQGSVAPSPYIACSDILTGEVSGRELTLKTEDAKGGFFNYGFSQGTFTYGVMLENTVNNTIQYLQSADVVNAELSSYYGYHYYRVKIPATIANGQYRVYPTYKLGTGEWQKIKLHNDTPKYLTINVTSAGVSLGEDNEGEISLESWNSPTDFIAEEEFEVYLTISNTFSTPKSVTLDAYLCKIENNRYKIYAELGSSTVTIPEKSKADMGFSGVLPKIDAGTYLLVFADDGTLVGTAEVEVKAPTPSGEFTVRSITPTPEVLVPGELSNVKAVIESSFNIAKQFEMGLYLCTLEDGTLYIQLEYGTQAKTIAPNRYATFSFSATIPDTFEDGEYYLVIANPDTYDLIDYIKVEVKSKTTSFETISTDETDGSWRYYNLQGVEVAADKLVPGIYIRRTNNKSEKIIVK